MEYLDQILPAVLDEWRIKSKATIYQLDPVAWGYDILGKSYYEKQREIATSYSQNIRTAVKSANGCGKSAIVADLICHWVSVYPPEEALAIISAPTIPQIERVIFAYLKNNYGIAKARKFPLRGQINEALEWKYETPEGKKFLAFGKKPADKDIVSSFQGTRKRRTAVFLDEAGGVPADLFTAAEAVTTGSDSRFVAIGNPDKRGTEFHRIFTDPKLSQDWETLTISAYDLPSFTGEIVYDDPVKQESFVKSLTSQEWVEHKKRAWGEGTARWMSKVLGEFPGEDDNTFFPQSTIDMGIETVIEPDSDSELYIGADIARFGQDETVIYTNISGKIRFHSAWSKMDNIAVARKLHETAIEVGASQVRVDAAGTGSGVYDALQVLEEFSAKTYILVGILGANASPDKNKWGNARAWHYDTLREGMANGLIDIDIEDSELREELISQTFKFNSRAALQMTSKDEARKSGLKSPDHLDAAIYSYIDIDPLLSNPLRDVAPGTELRMNPWEILGRERAMEAIL